MDVIFSLMTVLSAFSRHSAARPAIAQQTERIYAQEVRKLTNKANSWHFRARRARPEQIEQFRLEEMSTKMETDAPHLWSMLGAVMCCAAA